ncbi:uncharacterized protein JCM15063_001758 [Sporobolomyces koalae]|uniref:uncharacterized protein n=1 Tax=Sporobolomyces koalae TaxID=500713 RepID=UPI00317DEEFE
MKIRRKREKGTSTPPSTFNAFRSAERQFKDRNCPPRLDLVFDSRNIAWEDSEVDGKLKGTWMNETGDRDVCYRVSLQGLSETIGQSRWKGKAKETGRDYAIVIPRVPGLVFFPSIVPPETQRLLVVESLQNAKQPNVTSLDPHYALPPEGLWNVFHSGRLHEVVERIKSPMPASDQNSENTARSNTHGTPVRAESDDLIDSDSSKVTMEDLVPKLRWSNVGYHYNWTTKLYEFDRPFVPIPPLMLSCCSSIARAVPWHHVFEESDDECEAEGRTTRSDWASWSTDYEPDAGIVNFYQTKDTLTGHTDHSEVDAVLPLVSLSLGASSIFLVGGLTKDIPPLAILLRSGDGLIMSGREGRRAYHGLPRVLEDTLPDYLRARPSESDGTDSLAFDEQREWQLYGEYLERGSRININLRSGTKGDQIE